MRLKMVDGVVFPMSDEEIAEFDASMAIGNTPKIEDYTIAIKMMMDQAAQSRRYDNALSLSTYVTSSNDAWSAEATAFVAWRDQVWDYAYSELQKVQNQERTQPTVEDFLTELPKLTWGE